MTLRARLFLLVTLIIVLGVTSSATVFAFISWRSIAERTKENGTLLAQVLVQSVSVMQQLPLALEEIVADGTIAGADIIAHLTQLAREKGATPNEIIHSLQDVAAREGIPEIWVTDRQGTPIYWSLYDIDASIGVDSGLTLQPAFQPLLEGKKSSLFTSANHSLDSRQLYYGGVMMPDNSGMALVGRLLSDAKAFDNRVGLKRMLETVMTGAFIDAIRIFDTSLEQVAAASASDVQGASKLTGARLELLEGVLKNGVPDSRLDDHWAREALFGRTLLHVAAPIFGPDGLTSGAALMTLSMDMRKDLHTLLLLGGGLSALLLLSGMALALPFLNRTVSPLARLAIQTRRLVERNFKPDEEIHDELAKVTENRHDEVAYLGGTLCSMVTTLETYIADLKETTAAKERIEGELSAARSIQMGIVPSNFELPKHPECELYAVLEPAKAVGGDLYDFFLLDDQRLFFLIGDVSDKGVPAALFMAVTKTLFTAEAQRDASSIGRIMERVNRALCKDNPEGMFVTVFSGILDLHSGEITCSDGGHERPFVLRSDGTVEMVEKKKSGLVLGFMPDANYQEENIRLAAGDALLIYTDGISEAMNAKHELFKVNRLNDALVGLSPGYTAHTIIEGVLTAVSNFVSGHPQSDDITLLALRWHGPTGSAIPADPDMAVTV